MKFCPGCKRDLDVRKFICKGAVMTYCTECLTAPSDLPNVHNVIEGGIADSLAYVFWQLADMGAKTEAERHG